MNLQTIDWSKQMPEFLDYLYNLKDEKYKTFSKKITPGEFEMIGIQIPKLKIFAKNIVKGNYQSFLENCPTDIFELRLLKGLVIANIKNIEEYKNYFEEFIPLINNWAICDIFIAASKIIKKDEKYFFKRAQKLIKSKKEFPNRIGFVILLDYFIEIEYLNSIFNLIETFQSDKYYANMALAWLISVMYIKFTSETKQFLNEAKIDKTVWAMVKRKIKDSYRVSLNDKTYLDTIG